MRLCWLQEFQQEQERREELKQQIALAATRLLQDPEQHLRELQPLIQLVSSRDEVVSQRWTCACSHDIPSRADSGRECFSYSMSAPGMKC